MSIPATLVTCSLLASATATMRGRRGLATFSNVRPWLMQVIAHTDLAFQPGHLANGRVLIVRGAAFPTTNGTDSVKEHEMSKPADTSEPASELERLIAELSESGLLRHRRRRRGSPCGGRAAGGLAARGACPGRSTVMTGRSSATAVATLAGRRPAAARLRSSDLARLAAIGLRTRKLRATLSALGIAIEVAAIVAVLGLSSSSAAGLNAEIAALGTNLLTVQNAGQSLTGQPAGLPTFASGMISRLPGVYQVQSTGATTANVYRSPLIPSVTTNALTVDAAAVGLPAAAETSLAQGQFLNAATQTSRSACSAPPPPSCWASTVSSPGSGSGPATCGCM
jgi:hypothetical protein